MSGDLQKCAQRRDVQRMTTNRRPTASHVILLRHSLEDQNFPSLRSLLYGVSIGAVLISGALQISLISMCNEDSWIGRVGPRLCLLWHPFEDTLTESGKDLASGDKGPSRPETFPEPGRWTSL